MILLDTDHLSVLLEPRHAERPRFLARIEATDEKPAIPVVSVEEQLRAWLAQIHRVRDSHGQITPYRRLSKLISFLRNWTIADWEQTAAATFDRLRENRIRIGMQDLKIASIALANDALLLSANLRDFQQVPGLRVQDWVH
ncbi:MAG: type II toxin-antitoxin system VapC family toxin [Thermoguttaceae bacterium]